MYVVLKINSVFDSLRLSFLNLNFTITLVSNQQSQALMAKETRSQD